jgi:FkbM family methyltransferase
MLRTLKYMRGIAWARFSYLDYLVGLGLMFPWKPDFPGSLSLSKEITKNDVVLEVGANVGGNSRRLPKYAKFVHSFEPVPACYRSLLRNVRGIQNIKCYNMAVSDKTGETEFNIEYGLLYGGGSFFHQVQYVGGPEDKNPRLVPIRVKTIDINDIPFDFNVMVMDCEGADVPILRAFKRFDMVDRIYVECHIIDGQPTRGPLEEILRKHYSWVRADYDPRSSLWLVAKK